MKLTTTIYDGTVIPSEQIDGWRWCTHGTDRMHIPEISGKIKVRLYYDLHDLIRWDDRMSRFIVSIMEHVNSIQVYADY